MSSSHNNTTTTTTYTATVSHQQPPCRSPSYSSSSTLSSPPPTTPPSLAADDHTVAAATTTTSATSDLMLCPARLPSQHDLSPLSPLSPLPLPLATPLSHLSARPCSPAFRYTVSPASTSGSPTTPRLATKRQRPALDITVARPQSPRSPKRPRSAHNLDLSDEDDDCSTLQQQQQPLRKRPPPLKLVVPMRSPSPTGVLPEDEQPLSAATITPSFLTSIQHVKLAGDSSPPLDVPAGLSSRRTSSPPSLPPTFSLKRSNPKGLSLTLSLGAASFHNTTTTVASTPTPTGSPGSPRTHMSETPSTPGLPKTPSMSTGSIGRAPSSFKSGRRPSLLSLITHPPGSSVGADVPPTPGGAPYPYGSMRSRGHTRMRSAGTLTPPTFHNEMDPRTSQSAYPSIRTNGFPTIDERTPSTASTMGNPGMSPSTSLTSSSTSNGDSVTSTPSTSPPLPGETDIFGVQSHEPYADGPRELIPGVWLGAEDSPYYFDVWGRSSGTVATVNVAQEIENPFDENADMEAITTGWTSHKGKAKVELSTHHNEGQPIIEYAHLRWSHGESGLSEVPTDATLSQILDPKVSPSDTMSEKWRFWESVRWIEAHRRAGIPVIIHCQCGVSRSATLAVAYVMTLAAAGLMRERLGHLRTMQDAYDFVKNRSPWIGPNVSLVFQLVEYARHLSSLLSAHVATGGKPVDTEWPTLVDIETEDAWAQRRREFDDSEEHPAEALALDEAMKQRAGRVGR